MHRGTSKVVGWIILDVGSSEGFVPDMTMILTSVTTKDCKEEIDANCFEEWSRYSNHQTTTSKYTPHHNHLVLQSVVKYYD